MTILSNRFSSQKTKPRRPRYTGVPTCHVPPSARCLQAYLDYLGLPVSALKGMRILDLRPGPSSFAIEATLQGAQVIALDPLYRYRIDRLKQEYALIARQKGPQMFFEDYAGGVAAGRYRAHGLPDPYLLLTDFDLIVSHFMDTKAELLR